MRGPNMSYCMCENTLAAMRQILDAMREEGPQFIREMDKQELRSYMELFHVCESFLILADELEDTVAEEVDSVEEYIEWRDFDPDC